MLSPNTATIKEWPLPTPWSAPYDVVSTKWGEAWTGSMLTDRVSRLDTATGQGVDYLLPRTTNIRRVFVDESSGDRCSGSAAIMGRQSSRWNRSRLKRRLKP